MPELRLQEFNPGSPALSADLLNIQRDAAGTWTNYAIPVSAVNSMAFLEVTVDIADLQGGGVAILAAPTAGTMNIPIYAHMRYNPGGAFDGGLFAVELDDGASNVLGLCTFNFGPTSSASILSHDPVTFLPVNSSITMAMLGATLADGSVTLYMQYQNVFI